MFYRMYRISLMVTIGAILVAALGAAATGGIAAVRGELGMGMHPFGGRGMEMHMGGRHHERGAGKGPAIAQGEDSAGNPASDAVTAVRPMPPQWLMIAMGLLRAVVALVPLSLVVAGLAWILHRTDNQTPQPSA